MKGVIVGAGTYGQVYLSYLREYTPFEIVGFLDDNRNKINQITTGLPVLGTTKDFSKVKLQGVEGVFAPIGDNHARVRILTEARKEGLSTPNFIHPSAVLSKDVKIGEGVYILPGTVIMPYVEIDEFVMISIGVNIVHHTRLARGVFLSNGVNMGAMVNVGEFAFVGMGATIMTGVSTLGVNSLIGAGAVVIRDVPDGVTVVGVPARILRSS